MRITKEIQDAISKAAFDLGSQEELSKRTKISRTNISKYQTGGIKSIRDDNWKRLFPHIKKYLPTKYLDIEDFGPVMYLEAFRSKNKNALETLLKLIEGIDDDSELNFDKIPADLLNVLKKSIELMFVEYREKIIRYVERLHPRELLKLGAFLEENNINLEQSDIAPKSIAGNEIDECNEDLQGKCDTASPTDPSDVPPMV